MKTATVSFGKGLKEAWNWNKGDVLLLYTPKHRHSHRYVGYSLGWRSCLPYQSKLYDKRTGHSAKGLSAKAIATQRAYLKNACAAAEMAGIQQGRIILIGEGNDGNSVIRHFTDTSWVCLRVPTINELYQKTPKQSLHFLCIVAGQQATQKALCYLM